MASITSYTKAALDSKLALLATLLSPTFTGTPSLPTGTTGVTQSASDNSTKLATTAFTQSAVAALVNSSPSTLDTLKELADALGDDPNYAATVTTALGLKAPLASPALTGNPTAPTATVADNDTSIATTAFVQTALANAPTQAVADSSVKVATTAFVQQEKLKQITVNAATAYTLILTDANKVIESSNASVQTITIPPNSAVAFPIGTLIQLCWVGTAKPSFAAGAGVTLNSPGAVLGVAALWGTITARKRGTDLWVLSDAVG